MVTSIVPSQVLLFLVIGGRVPFKRASDSKEGNVASEVKDVSYKEKMSQRGKEARSS